MHHNNLKIQLVLLLASLLSLQMVKVSSYKGNYEAKYSKANVPLWKQRACEKSQKYKANSHYVCDDKGDVKCLPGWQGDLCQVPMCRRGCDPMNGYCQRPGECRCRIGYTGELCDKCIPLPGCQHGDCTKPFECICHPGWDGLFCTEPTCRQGCHNTRGYCETPGECRCRIGWAGRNCSDCSVLPGCQHGTCTKPLECLCLPGYTGLLCQTPICNADCHKQHGWCKKPGECRCKVGWTGVNCDICFPYPGCVNGDCEKPWECNCKPGWGGILCDEELTYCKEHPNACENEGKCVSLTKEDGSYRCLCKQGFLGKNCEIVDEFLLTSTSAPRITPPPLVDWPEEEKEDNHASLSNENELKSSLKNKQKEASLLNFNKTTTADGKQDALGINTSTYNTYENVTKFDGSTGQREQAKVKQEPVLNVNKVAQPEEKFDNSTSLYGNIAAASDLHFKTANVSTVEPLKQMAAVSLDLFNATNATIYMPQNTKNSTTVLSPLNKLDDEKNLHSLPLKPADANKKPDKENLDDDEADEECTDEDNDDECEYVDEDEDDDVF